MNILCALGFHKFRTGLKRAEWRMTFLTPTLDLHCCTRCGVVRDEDLEEVRSLTSAALVPQPVIVEVPRAEEAAHHKASARMEM